MIASFCRTQLTDIIAQMPKPLLGMPTTHTRVSVRVSAILLPKRLPANIPWRWQITVQVPEPLSLIWETQMKFQTPGCSLACPGLLWSLIIKQLVLWQSMLSHCLGHPIWALVRDSTASLPTHLAANVPGLAKADGPHPRGSSWKAEKGLPSVGSLPRCLQQLRLVLAETGIQELHPGLPCEWQGPIYLGHQLLPTSSVFISRKLDQKPSPGLNFFIDLMNMFLKDVTAMFCGA